nr:putative reverse transcriptase, RNA-dependent DNA polymerase [Tanacetum cinerariifolium]
MVYHIDVKSAFLYGTIDEEVYVCQPPGSEDPDYPDKVYKVVKALYGLHQAPRAWYETLANYLLENGFQRELCKAFEKLMKDKFQMSSMGELTFFLGLQVKQKEDRIFISQDKYVAEMLRKFGLTDGKSASTPIDTKKHLLKDPDDLAIQIAPNLMDLIVFVLLKKMGLHFNLDFGLKGEGPLRPYALDNMVDSNHNEVNSILDPSFTDNEILADFIAKQKGKLASHKRRLNPTRPFRSIKQKDVVHSKAILNKKKDHNKGLDVTRSQLGVPDIESNLRRNLRALKAVLKPWSKNLRHKSVQESALLTENLKELDLKAEIGVLSESDCNLRLESVMSTIISNVQTTFLKDRQITYGPLIINDVISWTKKVNGKLMIFKVDFEKSFDSINWDFIHDGMDQMGFGVKWRDWIFGCLRSGYSSILINGSPSKEFKLSKGLRQGDPMSRFLFIIAMEALHIAMMEVREKGVFKGVEVILNGDSPTPTRVVDGVVQAVAPTTAKQRLAKKNELKAKDTLLMASPDKHQLKFNTYKDAKSLLEAIDKSIKSSTSSKREREIEGEREIKRERGREEERERGREREREGKREKEREGERARSWSSKVEHTAYVLAVVNSSHVDYAKIIWNDIIYQVMQSSYKAILHPQYTKISINHVFTTHPTIPKRVYEPYHNIKDDDPDRMTFAIEDEEGNLRFLDDLLVEPDTRLNQGSHKERLEEKNDDDDEDNNVDDALIQRKQMGSLENREHEKQKPIATPPKSSKIDLYSDKAPTSELTNTNVHMSDVPSHSLFQRAKHL